LRSVWAPCDDMLAVIL